MTTEGLVQVPCDEAQTAFGRQEKVVIVAVAEKGIVVGQPGVYRHEAQEAVHIDVAPQGLLEDRISGILQVLEQVHEPSGVGGSNGGSGLVSGGIGGPVVSEIFQSPDPLRFCQDSAFGT
jgi:hypothetical protein